MQFLDRPEQPATSVLGVWAMEDRRQDYTYKQAHQWNVDGRGGHNGGDCFWLWKIHSKKVKSDCKRFAAPVMWCTDCADV